MSWKNTKICVSHLAEMATVEPIVGRWKFFFFLVRLLHTWLNTTVTVKSKTNKGNKSRQLTFRLKPYLPGFITPALCCKTHRASDFLDISLERTGLVVMLLQLRNNKGLLMALLFFKEIIEWMSYIHTCMYVCMYVCVFVKYLMQQVQSTLYL